MLSSSAATLPEQDQELLGICRISLLIPALKKSECQELVSAPVLGQRVLHPSMDLLGFEKDKCEKHPYC